MAGLNIKKGEVKVVSEEVHIESRALAAHVHADVNEVAQHLSEVIGPVSPDDISVDAHGKVIIRNKFVAAAASVGLISPLDNLICNHHLICAPG